MTNHESVNNIFKHWTNVCICLLTNAINFDVWISCLAPFLHVAPDVVWLLLSLWSKSSWAQRFYKGIDHVIEVTIKLNMIKSLPTSLPSSLAFELRTVECLSKLF